MITFRSESGPQTALIEYPCFMGVISFCMLYSRAFFSDLLLSILQWGHSFECVNSAGFRICPHHWCLWRSWTFLWSQLPFSVKSTHNGKVAWLTILTDKGFNSSNYFVFCDSQTSPGVILDYKIRHKIHHCTDTYTLHSEQIQDKH